MCLHIWFSDFTCPATVVTNTDPGNATAIVKWLNPVATDTTDHSHSVTCLPPSGTSFTIGASTVVCKTLDSRGNEQTCHFDIKVEGIYIMVAPRDTRGKVIFQKGYCPPTDHLLL